jgi:hypothetical protein
MHVILLHINHQQVLAPHVAFFRAMRIKMHLYLKYTKNLRLKTKSCPYV